jgi:hypothetical protein
MPLIPSPSPEGQQTPDASGKRSLIELSLGQWEKRRQEALTFDFSSVGCDPTMLAETQRFRGAYETFAKESGGDPERALQLLGARGIRIVRNSRLLSGQQMLTKASAFGAFFATPAILESLRKQYSDGSAALRQELDECQGADGVIFLDKAPRAKSVFHEAAHAVQQLEGLEMDAKDPVIHAYRELEANTSLITAHDQGLIPAITKGNYAEIKSPFGGKTAKVDPNDIYAEAQYFEANRSALEAAVKQRDAQQAENLRQQLTDPS